MTENTQVNPFIEVVRNPQSYRNLAYLMLSFPAGLAYFLLLVIGFSVGTSLVVIGVGVLILWLTFGLTLMAANAERWMANSLLKANIQGKNEDVFNVKEVSKTENWKAMFYLFLKFPLGILSFTITTSVISLILGLITAPLSYNFELLQFGGRSIDSLWEALVAMLFGIILLPIGMMFLNKIAWWWRRLSRYLLETESGVSEKAKHIDRAAIEAEVMQRLADEGRLVDSQVAYYEEDMKQKNEWG